MRHIILDTETTGLSHSEGHRIIEIGAVEMVNFSLTGERLHLYINPEREIDEGAVSIHGITSEFLTDKPLFQDIAAQFLEFIGDDMLVIHNAPFDVGFLNAELARMAKAALSMDRVVDTLQMARQKFPGAQASLDALCRRFDIDNTHRDLHGALIDAHLLADVFIELEGGKEPGFNLNYEADQPQNTAQDTDTSELAGFEIIDRPLRPARAHQATDEELDAHHLMISKLPSAVFLGGHNSPPEKEQPDNSLADNDQTDTPQP